MLPLSAGRGTGTEICEVVYMENIQDLYGTEQKTFLLLGYGPAPGGCDRHHALYDHEEDIHAGQ